MDPLKGIQQVHLAVLCLPAVYLFKNVIIPKVLIVAVIVAVLYFLAVIDSLYS